LGERFCAGWKNRAVAIDYEAEGLLKGTRGKARQARRELLEELEADGVPLEELKQAVAEDRLALLPVERALEPEGKRYTAAEIAEETGLDEEFLVRQRHALGLSSPEPGAREFTEQDLEVAQRLRVLLEAGIPESGLLEVARVMGLALAQVAAANRRVIEQTFMHPGVTELELAQRLASAANQLRPMVGPLLDYALDLHLRQQIRMDVLGREELAAGRRGADEVTACFADLVGFTKLGEELQPEDLGAVTGRLDELARDVVEPPVQLVKMIGDAAMLVSIDNDAMLDGALALVDAAEAEGEGFPSLRAGLARGAALQRAGDWFGRSVNMASRITAIAYPASVLASEEVHEASADRYRWSDAGARRLKGFDRAVRLFRARREEE
jgi:adenylate cyclase